MSGHPGAQKLVLPRLYAILDLTSLSARDSRTPVSSVQVAEYAKELVAGGVTLLQYRAKSLSSREILGQARELRRIVGSTVQLIMNDRADLCLAAGFNGVHLGQDDLSPEGARRVVGERLWIGVSTHNLEQLARADIGLADYLAFGPIFGTDAAATKL